MWSGLKVQCPHPTLEFLKYIQLLKYSNYSSSWSTQISPVEGNYFYTNKELLITGQWIACVIFLDRKQNMEAHLCILPAAILFRVQSSPAVILSRNAHSSPIFLLSPAVLELSISFAQWVKWKDPLVILFTDLLNVYPIQHQHVFLAY